MHIANKQEYCVRTQDDLETCNIECVCLLPGGSVLLSDVENAAVKLLDSFFHVTSTYYPPASPFGICVVSDSEVAVAVANKTVEFLSVGTGITLNRVISLNHDCYGIAHHHDKLYITYPGENLLSDGAVYVYSLIGSRLGVHNKDPTGRDIFSRPCHIAVSTCGNILHVADLDFGLITLYKDGSHVSKFTPGDVLGAIGLCLADDDSVLVSGLNSHNVVQIDTRDAKVVADISPPSAGLFEPIGLCIDTCRSKFLLAVKNRDTIFVYDLIR